MRVVEIGAVAMAREMKATQYLFVMVPTPGKKPVKTKRPVELCDWRMLRDALTKGLNLFERGIRTSLDKKERL
jgi:hypothetical protein